MMLQILIALDCFTTVLVEKFHKGETRFLKFVDWAFGYARIQFDDALKIQSVRFRYRA